jgi:hypothetical protein
VFVGVNRSGLGAFSRLQGAAPTGINVWWSMQPPASGTITSAKNNNLTQHPLYNELISGVGGGSAGAQTSPPMQRIGSARFDAVSAQPVAPHNRKYVASAPAKTHRSASNIAAEPLLSPSRHTLLRSNPLTAVPSPELSPRSSHNLQHIPPHARSTHALAIGSSALVTTSTVPTGGPAAGLRASRLELSHQVPNIMGPI